jgi:hypothetical protein
VHSKCRFLSNCCHLLYHLAVVTNRHVF